MNTKLLSLLSGLLLVSCLVPGRVTVSGATDPYWDGITYVNVTNHSHCENCGHYYYGGGWNLYPSGHVYVEQGYGPRHDNGNGGGKGKGKGKGH